MRKEADPVIYADNAATTALDIDAFEAMKPYLIKEYGNAFQPYSFARPAKKALVVARKTIADCIGAQPEEIIFTSVVQRAITGLLKAHCNMAMVVLF